MRSSLTVVATRPQPKCLADKLAGLQAEIASLSREQVSDLIASLATTSQVASNVAANGAQPPGIRDLARRIAEDCEARGQTLEAIVGRTA